MANVAPPANDEERLRACLVVCGLTTAHAQDGIIVQEGYTTLQELSRLRPDEVSDVTTSLRRRTQADSDFTFSLMIQHMWCTSYYM